VLKYGFVFFSCRNVTTLHPFDGNILGLRELRHPDQARFSWATVRSTRERLRMKKLLLIGALSVAMAASAAAGDLGPGRVVLPEWNWTGFYFGIHGGFGYGTTESSITGQQQCNGGVCGATTPLIFGSSAPFQSRVTLNGLQGGGTAGFNWQSGPFVFGVEGDISGANIDGSDDCAFSFGAAEIFVAGCHTRVQWLGTIAGRLGVTVGPALVYVKGGGALAHYDENVNITSGVPRVAVIASIGNNRSGFVVGTGIEYAFWGNWSAKVEYDYMDFGTGNFAFPFVDASGVTKFNYFADDRERLQVIKAGLNYRFGGGPISTKY
jgi:outer membrane immunogenic protein